MTKELLSFFQARGWVQAYGQNRRSIMAACEDPTTMATYNYSGTVWPLPQTNQMHLEHFLLDHLQKNPSFGAGMVCQTTSYRQEPNPAIPRCAHLCVCACARVCAVSRSLTLYARVEDRAGLVTVTDSVCSRETVGQADQSCHTEATSLAVLSRRRWVRPKVRYRGHRRRRCRRSRSRWKWRCYGKHSN